VNYRAALILSAIGLFCLGCNKSNHLEIGKPATINEPSGMWINQKPSIKAKGIISVPDGETISVIQSGPPEKLYGIQSNWYKVQWRNHVGWMWGGLAKTSLESTEKPKPPLRLQKKILTSVTAKEVNSKFGQEYFSPLVPEDCFISGYYGYFVDQGGKEVLHGSFNLVRSSSIITCTGGTVSESVSGTYENGKPYGYFEFGSRGYEGPDSHLTLFMNRKGNCNGVRYSFGSRFENIDYVAEGLNDCAQHNIAALAEKNGKKTKPRMY